MEKIKAIELLIQESNKIPHLKTLPYDNDEFPLWLKTVENIINVGLEPDDKQKYLDASNVLKFIRYEEDLKQQDYIDEIVRYEIVVKSIIQRYEILGIDSGNISQKLLNDIFSAFIKSPDGLNRQRFRADNYQFLPEIDQLEHLGVIKIEGDLYSITPLALAQLSQQNPEAQEIVRICSRVFDFLRGGYNDNLDQPIALSVLSIGTQLPIEKLKVASRIIIQTPILGGYNIHPVDDKAHLRPSENILKYNSFEDLLKQIQRWAKEQDNRSHESMKIDIPSPEYPPEQSIPLSESRANWVVIKNEYGFTKRSFGKRINFVKDSFKRTAIYRDIEQAFILERSGFSKPAVILAGGVIEELLRLYLKRKGISPQKPLKKDFYGYIQTCEQKGILKAGIASLSDFARHFRNLVHLSNEETKRHAISKSTAKNAVASIFTIVNDF